MASKVLAVDDNMVNLKVVRATLVRAGFDVFTASSGDEALAMVKEMIPDIILLDITMPDMDGYEVCRRLRARPETSQVPVMMLTAHDTLEEKVKGFEAGADDYLTKPFQPAELEARIRVHLRRRQTITIAKAEEKARMISVFSLRGGVGVTSLATNIACGLAQTWQKPVAFVDLSLTMGQSALMLNLPLRHTWSDLANIPITEIDVDLLRDIMLQHSSGVSVLAAPRHVEDGEMITPEIVSRVIEVLKTHYAYIVFDLPHDFSETSLAALDISDDVVVVMAPDFASVRATSELIEVFNRLGYHLGKSSIVMNWIFERRGLAKKDIEGVLKRKIPWVIPFASELVVQAINLGAPFILEDKPNPLGIAVEDMVFDLSKQEDQDSKPESPSLFWRRITERRSRK
ncbi:MAG: response regulator receiver protein [Chloroflexi bacterium HGW-Chloroflexi-10]|nr:MAG: response regulator receiver protein [Chloroflexi bacterium HGW-Chloroflexi-10]